MSGARNSLPPTGGTGVPLRESERMASPPPPIPFPTRARPRSMATDRATWAVLAIVALVLLVPITWGVDPLYSWDVDAIAPGAVLRAFAARFGTSWHGSYGPVPYFMFGIVYAPLLALLKLTGELGQPVAAYPWGFQHPERSMGLLIVGARLVSVALAVGIGAMAAGEARRDGVRRPWIAPLLLLGSAVFAYYGRSTNVDIFMFFWLWLGFHLLERPNPSVGVLGAAAAAATMAVCSKEQSAPVAMVVCLGAAWRAWRMPGTGSPVARVALVALCAAVAYAAVWRLPFGLEGWRLHHDYIFHVAKYPRTYPLTPLGLARLAWKAVRELPLVLGPAALLAALLGAWARDRWRGLGFRLAAGVFYLVAFIASIGYVYPRFLFPLALVAVPLATRALDRMADAPSVAPRLAVATLLVLTLAGGPAVSAAMLVDPRLTAEQWMARRFAHAPSTLVEVAGNPRYQARLPHAVPALYTRADSLGAEAAAPAGDLVLVSSIDRYTFERQPAAHAWWTALNAPAPAPHRWDKLQFASPAFAQLIGGLPVAPTVWIYVRTATDAAR